MSITSKSTKTPSPDVTFFSDLIKALSVLIVGPFWLSAWGAKRINESSLGAKPLVRVLAAILLLAGIFVLFGLLSNLILLKPLIKASAIYISLVLGFFGFWILCSDLMDRKKPSRITVDKLENHAQSFNGLLPILVDPMNIPLGVSLQSQKPFSIPVIQSLEHVLICGATGVGKTSLLMTMLQHCMCHNYPAIIIDPKGDFVDLDIIKDLAKTFGREDDLMVFSLSNPNESCAYNPIKLGTPENKKSKLMDGLSLSHEYYGAIASMVLINIFEILNALGEPNADLSRVLSILIDQETRAELEARLVNLPESPETGLLLKNLKAIRQVSLKDISGLCAQLQNFTMSEFKGIMLNESGKTEIDMLDVLTKGKIAYFQLNTNAYSDLARRFGKLLIEDIKFTSNTIQSNREMPRAKFAGVFIDEFGSFATKEFANIQKMVRSAGISLRLFYQGMADLRAVSPEFEDQVLGNTLTKIILRQDVDSDVEKWSGMAGTVSDLIESYQIEDTVLMKIRTGMGNMHEGKRMKIDFDVFKQLGKGQAVVIDKGRRIQDVIEIWDSKNSKFQTEVKNYMAKLPGSVGTRACQSKTSTEVSMSDGDSIIGRQDSNFGSGFSSAKDAKRASPGHKQNSKLI